MVFGVVGSQQSLQVFNTGEDQHYRRADATGEEHDLKQANADSYEDTHIGSNVS